MSDNTVKITLQVTDDGSIKILDQVPGKIGNARKETESWTASLKANWVAVTAAAAAIALTVRRVDAYMTSAANLGSEIKRNSQILNMNTAEYQIWDMMAKRSGITGQDLILGFKALSISIEENNKLFGAMGVKTRDATGAIRPFNQIMFDIKARFNEWNDGSRKMTYANELFTRSAEPMLRMFNANEGALSEIQEEMKKYGGVVDDALIAKANQAEEVFTRQKIAAERFKLELSDIVLYYAKILEKGTELIKFFKEIPARQKAGTEMGTFNMETGEFIPQPKSKAVFNADEGMAGLKRSPPPEIIDRQKLLEGEAKAWQELSIEVDTMWGKTKMYSRDVESFMAGYMEITTDEIERWDQIIDKNGKVVALTAVYRKELINIDAEGKRILATDEAISNQYSAQFEIRKQLGLEYEVPDALYDKELILKGINDELEKERKRQQIIYDMEHQQFEDRRKGEGLAYEMPTEAETYAMNRRSIENSFKQMSEIRDFWDKTTIDMGQSMMGNFFKFAEGGFKDLNGLIKDFAKTGISALEQLISNALLFGNIMGMKNASGGYGGFVGLVGGALGSLFGSSGGGATGSLTNYLTAANGALFPGPFIPIQAFAGGGMVNRPTLGLIGEGGEREYVIPESKMGRMGHTTINYYDYSMKIARVDASDAASFEAKVVSAVHKNRTHRGILSK
jgi:hypothetical protein